MKTIVAIIGFCLFAIFANSQNIPGIIKSKFKQHTEAKADSANGGAAEATAPAAENPQDTKAAAPANDFKTFQNYDFVPGDKVLFEDDWHDDEVGEFPAHWKLVNGEFLVNKFEGANVLVAKERSDPDGGSATWGIMPRMKTDDYLPKEFTVELEVYAFPKKKHEGWDDDINSHSVAIELLKANNDDYPSGQTTLNFFREGTASTYGFPNEFNKSGLESGQTHLLCLSYKNNQLKIYLNGKRLFSVPDVGIEPARVRLVVPNNGPDEPLIIKHIRIAEGGNMNLIKKLTTENKFIARGIAFDFNKATIRPESMGELNRIISFMNEDKNVQFEIGGHTDSDGDDTYNLKLSQQRADAVKAKLVELGISAARLTTKGYGETKPISDNSSPEGKANNRRVEFVKK
jgi:outer membrane protein OmpA-like peptidoglycan-associated protein